MDEFPFGWLDPVLDRCRADIVSAGRPLRREKTLADGTTAEVTDVDLHVEQVLVAAIRTTFSGAAILSEESFPNKAALASELCFVIDPIDGTRELIAGSRDFGIAVGVFANGRPVAGVLDLPLCDKRFTCTAGSGVRLNGVRVRLVEPPALHTARVAVSPTQLADPSLRTFWHRLRTTEIVPVGALTPKVARVVSGDCDAALFAPVPGKVAYIWDYGVAALLLAESGGMLTSFDGADLLQALPFAHEGGWIAGTRNLCREIRWSTQR
jgi:myo-inositol-1(or 4)-monophosphatase